MFFCCYCVQCFFLWEPEKEGTYTHYIDKFRHVCVAGRFRHTTKGQRPRLKTCGSTRHHLKQGVRRFFFFNKTGFVVLHTRHQVARSMILFFRQMAAAGANFRSLFLTSFFYGTPSFHLNLLRRTISSPSNQLRLMQQMAPRQHCHR